MATAIRNVSGEDRIVPWLGGRLVVADAVVEVPDEDAEAYLCQTETWAPAGKPSKPAKTAADNGDSSEKE